MAFRLLPSTSARIVGILFTVTGIVMLIATVLALLSVSFYSGISLVSILGGSLLSIGLPAVAVLLSGIGLLRNRIWGWLLGVLIALSGILVVTIRLIVNDGNESSLLFPALVTDVLVAILLFAGRPRETRQDARH